MIQFIGRVISNLIRYYWHVLFLGFLIIWVLLSYIGSLTEWKAVFLDNTQVYFGHYFHMPFSRFATLRDVHFLRGGTTTESAIIVPLTSEPHGPKSYMKVNVDHVVAVHILRPDSSLVKTIEADQSAK